MAKPSREEITRYLENIVIKRLAAWKDNPYQVDLADRPRKPTSKSIEESQLTTAITSKIEVGNFHAAIRLITPKTNLHRCQAIQVSPEEVINNLKTFLAGSSGGPDGPMAQYILEQMCSRLLMLQITQI